MTHGNIWLVLALLLSAITFAAEPISRASECTDQEMEKIREDARETTEYPLFLFNRQDKPIGVIRVGYVQEATENQYPVRRAQLCGDLPIARFNQPILGADILKNWISPGAGELILREGQSEFAVNINWLGTRGEYLVSGITYIVFNDPKDFPGNPETIGEATLSIPKIFLH